MRKSIGGIRNKLIFVYLFLSLSLSLSLSLPLSCMPREKLSHNFCPRLLRVNLKENLKEKFIIT